MSGFIATQQHSFDLSEELQQVGGVSLEGLSNLVLKEDREVLVLEPLPS